VKGATRVCRKQCCHGVPLLGVPGFRGVSRVDRALTTDDVLLGGSKRGRSPSWNTGNSTLFLFKLKREGSFAVLISELVLPMAPVALPGRLASPLLSGSLPIPMTLDASSRLPSLASISTPGTATRR